MNLAQVQCPAHSANNELIDELIVRGNGRLEGEERVREEEELAMRRIHEDKDSEQVNSDAEDVGSPNLSHIGYVHNEGTR